MQKGLSPLFFFASAKTNSHLSPENLGKGKWTYLLCSHTDMMDPPLKNSALLLTNFVAVRYNRNIKRRRHFCVIFGTRSRQNVACVFVCYTGAISFCVGHFLGCTALSPMVWITGRRGVDVTCWSLLLGRHALFFFVFSHFFAEHFWLRLLRRRLLPRR